jgi:hypothetical protein
MSSSECALSFNIDSETSDDVYKVDFVFNDSTYQLEGECTCGVKFNCGKRKKCKHIDYIARFVLTGENFQSNVFEENSLAFNVNSERNDDVYYVEFFYDESTYKLEAECTCGVKFNCGRRNKCKHIDYVVKNMLTNKKFRSSKNKK